MRVQTLRLCMFRVTRPAKLVRESYKVQHLESWQMGWQATPAPPRRASEKPRFKNMVVSVSSPPKDLYTLKSLPVVYQIHAWPPRARPLCVQLYWNIHVRQDESEDLCTSGVRILSIKRAGDGRRAEAKQARQKMLADPIRRNDY